jgi:hypothetical protein
VRCPKAGEMRQRSSDAYASAVLGSRCRIARTLAGLGIEGDVPPSQIWTLSGMLKTRQRRSETPSSRAVPERLGPPSAALRAPDDPPGRPRAALTLEDARHCQPFLLQLS